MALVAALEVFVALVHGIMSVWHYASTRTHERRAIERGET